jgi:hypothetical protein
VITLCTWVPSTRARSTLFGGYYELLDHQNNFRPNPSFWLAKLWKLFVGGGATPSSGGGEVPGAPLLYIWEFSTGSKVSTFAVNLRPSAHTVNLTTTASSFSQWLLTSKDGLKSKSVYLNGAANPLELGADGLVPAGMLAPASKEGTELALPPHSIALVVAG